MISVWKVEGVVSGLSCLVWVGVAAASPALVVATDTTRVHASPSVDSARVGRLGSGVTVCVIDEPGAAIVHQPGWTAIRLSDGMAGYVPASAVDIGQAPPDDPSCRAPRVATRVASGAPLLPRTRRLVYVDPGPPPEPPHPPPEPGEAGAFLPRHPVRVTFGFGLGVAGMSDQAAAPQSLSSVAPAVELSAGLQLSDVFAITGVFGVVMPSDSAGFSQVVMPVDGGDASSASSEVSVLRYAVDITARSPSSRSARPARAGSAARCSAALGSSASPAAAPSTTAAIAASMISR